ncbi:hypothetical protein ACFVKB_42410 [Rhodococcus sp. NPDC127530]|uniref:hypothetical protein n=1 Tax=Rhodococcus sp. NPDC127530 TaxID=3345397 RepID=UPI003629746E
MWLADCPTRPRVDSALEIVGCLRRLRFQINDLEDRIKTVLDECGSTLQNIRGVGPIMAGRILARTGSVVTGSAAVLTLPRYLRGVNGCQPRGIYRVTR